jgi:putative GTP pyrophosphokinase
MTEEEFLELWHEQRPIVEAWGKFVAHKIMDQLTTLVAPVKADVFIRIPVRPRLKQDGSLLTKAFYRDKDYADPFEEITDKVGVRFVVLLAQQMPIVSKAIEDCSDWEWSKDKDYEAERERNPYAFHYQSDHYILRSRDSHKLDGVTVPAGTTCEVQVRTLLQHAHSEVTHDTIYKPSVVQTPRMHRAAAKAMALVEATDDYLEELMELIEEGVEPNRQLSRQLVALYQEIVGTDPDPTKAEGLLNDAFAPFAGDNPIEAVRQFIEQKPFVVERIRERVSKKLLFRQPSIFLAYMAISARPGDAREAWPLTPSEMKPIFADLGISNPAS